MVIPKIDFSLFVVFSLASVETTCAKSTVQYAVRCLLMLVRNKSSGFVGKGRGMLTGARAIEEEPTLSETGVSVG
jgi:hypothetical protein